MEHLLNPISEETPCGEYLKGNRSLYRGLRNSFNMAQSSFRQLIESPEAMSNEELLDANANNWSELKQQCEVTLQQTSKDTEVFCWLATAQLFGADPLSNLADVLETFTESVDRFWDDLNPKPPVEKLKASDDAGQKQEWAEHRTKPLLQLIGDTHDSGLLYMPLQLISLIGDIDYGRYFSAERAGELAQLKDEAQAAISDEKDQVIHSVLSLGRCIDALELMEQKLNQHCQQDGASGISFRFVKESIERLLNAIRYLAGEQLNPWPLDKVEEPELPAEIEPESNSHTSEVNDASADVSAQMGSSTFASQSVTNTIVASGDIMNRDQAFQQLRKISDFLRQTEPHSPVYMLLERAIRWGYMPLPELLSEMVGDNDQVMGRITQLAGLETTEKITLPDAPAPIGVVQSASMNSVPTQPTQNVPAPQNPQESVPIVQVPAQSQEQESSSASVRMPKEGSSDQTQETESTDSDTKIANVSNFEW